MKTIDTAQRKRIFGLVKEAHRCSGSHLPIETWRREVQRDEGIESLSSCPADQGLKLMNRLHRIIDDCRSADAGSGKRGGDAASTKKKRGPAGGRPKGILEWSGGQQAQLEKVEALCADMGLPWDYADGIAKRMFGSSVLRVDTLDGRQLRAVITALVKRQQQHGGRRTPAAVSDYKSQREEKGVHHG